jgi:hypothetical protein
MPIAMPYHLEKGPTLRLIEEHLNDSTAAMLQTLQGLRTTPPNSPAWLQNSMPALWADPRFQQSPAGSGAAVRDDLMRNWLGFHEDPNAPGVWTAGTEATTGYWIGYRGNVSEIVRNAFQWALELALGLDHPGSTANPRPDPWPIELFWKCPTPWFEAWVVQRPIDPAQTRGLISVMFLTPSFEGSNVCKSPLATHATATPPGFSHPVASWQPDYEWLGHTSRARVTPLNRRYSTWVVSDMGHVVTGVQQTHANTEADFFDWGIAQVNIWNGVGDVVVVSPSFPSGGISWDGQV